jgi:hypothetical protein
MEMVVEMQRFLLSSGETVHRSEGDSFSSGTLFVVALL